MDKIRGVGLNVFAGIFGVFMMFFIAGCAHEEAKPTMPKDGNYVLFTLDGVEPSTPEPVELKLEKGQLSGRGPINRWTTELKGDQVGVFAVTRMAGPADLMSVESKLMGAMENSTIRVGPQNRLEFVRGGKIRAVFLPKSR
ncbi:MAG: META domain-containing protein [Puniceicoccales bacterium]